VKYLMLRGKEREALLNQLEAMPVFLKQRFAALSATDAMTEGPNQTFSPVEQCWHLADLEREGFGTRIRRLLEEEAPHLPDFDGGRIARERQYRTRSLSEGLSAFRIARQANLDSLRTLVADQWARAGTQEGVGRLMLCDLPHMMAEHDSSHRAEIDAWVKSRGLPTPRRR
jgi:hypothetical protein